MSTAAQRLSALERAGVRGDILEIVNYHEVGR